MAETNGGYIFGPGTPWTYDQLQSKRKIAEQLMRSNGTPRNVGEGLNALGKGIAAAILNKRANTREGELRDAFNTDWNAFLGNMSGSGYNAASGYGGTSGYGTDSYSAPKSSDPNDPRNIASETMSALGFVPDNAGAGQYSGNPETAPYANAIASVESDGSGGYNAIGPATSGGSRAYGRYQVMDFNIPDWTEKYVGRRMTPQEFLADPAAQDAVFSGEFGSYLKKYGNPNDAASAWFTGRPLAQGGNASDGYINGNEYVRRFNNGLQANTAQPQPAQATPATAVSPLGMIGGARGDGQYWQPLDGQGMAHAANPDYRDYSQLFRDYSLTQHPGWVPVGQRDGRTIYAAPDYARGPDGNYLSVSAADARRMAAERGDVIPTRDEIKALYGAAQQIPMPTQPIGETGGTGDSAAYTAAVTAAMNGLAPGTPVVHGKEFYSPAQAGALVTPPPEALAPTPDGALVTPPPGVLAPTPAGALVTPPLPSNPVASTSGPVAAPATPQPRTYTPTPAPAPTGGYSPVPAQGNPQGNMQTIMQLAQFASNPMASPGQRMVAQAMLQQQMAQMQPQSREEQLRMQLLEQQVADATAPSAREIVNDVNGRPRYRDTMELVYPDVTPVDGRDGINITVGGESSQWGDPPKDHVWLRDPNGNVVTEPDQSGRGVRPVSVPIIGSEADLNAVDATTRNESKMDAALTASDVVTNAARRARDAEGKLNFGPGATSIVGMLPWTDSAEIMRQVAVLKGNATIENLNMMRRNSPTGGALGNVTEKEGAMLAAKSGALDPNSPNFLRDLDDYERTLLRLIHGREMGDAIFAQTRDKPNPPPSGGPSLLAPPPGPQSGAVPDQVYGPQPESDDDFLKRMGLK